jgi:hypothetical protein
VSFCQSHRAVRQGESDPSGYLREGQRKDDVATELRAKYLYREGVIFVGKAQEKCTVYRTEKRHNPKKNTS